MSFPPTFTTSFFCKGGTRGPLRVDGFSRHLVISNRRRRGRDSPASGGTPPSLEFGSSGGGTHGPFRVNGFPAYVDETAEGATRLRRGFGGQGFPAGGWSAEVHQLFGGGGEIRTRGGLPHDGFQDRCLKPLGYPSAKQLIEMSVGGELADPCGSTVFPAPYAQFFFLRRGRDSPASGGTPPC